MQNPSEGKRDGFTYVGIGLFFSAFITFYEKTFPVLILGIIYIIAGVKTLISHIETLCGWPKAAILCHQARKKWLKNGLYKR